MAATTFPAAHDIAGRFARLPLDKRRAFLDALRTRGIAFSRLPVVPLGGRTENGGTENGAAENRGGEAVPASPAQKRLWTLTRLAPDSAAYGMPGLFGLRGILDADALEAALTLVVERHAVLRGICREGADGGLTVEFLPAASVRLDRRDLRDLPPTDREAEAAALAERLGTAPYDLTREPPIRAGLLRMGMEEHRLVVTIHHIAADGASIPILVSELAEAYRALRRGEPPRLPELPVRYADVAAWQAAWLEAGEAERQTAFWRDRLAGAPALLTLPTDRPRPANPGDAGAEQAMTLPPPLAGALRTLARSEGCTLFALLLAAHALLLGRLAGQEDVVIGIPVAGRRQPEAERLIGCFVNTLPVRLRIAPDRSFRDWLALVARAVAEAQDHQDLPFEAIAEALKAERGAGPLLQATFDHSAAPAVFGGLDGLTIEPLDLPVRTAKFDLALATAERADGSILARLAHRTALFAPAAAVRILRRWLRVLEEIAASPDRPLNRIDPRTEEERAAIAGWSLDPAWIAGETDGEIRRRAALPLPLRLAEVAAARPEAPAVLFGDAVLTHGALNRRANRLAHRLRALGAGPETRVGVSLPRTPDLLVALLGVLRSGAAFVPLDPADPPDRRRAIREAAGLSCLIAHDALDDALDDLPLLSPDDGADFPGDEPAVAIHPRSLAYIIHTSGSTGRPKGVAVEHGPLAMHCAATGALYDMTEDSRELHFLSFTFDGAHERWMTALSHGGCILLRDDSLWTPEQTYDAIRRHRVTHAGFPPKYLQQLAAWAEMQAGGAQGGGAGGGEPPPVQLYSFGGEAMPRAGLTRLFASLRPRTAINGYGPTETVVTPLAWKGDGASIPDCAYVPIGRPVGDRSARILDGHLAAVPIGVTGELWIGGSGLARGYAGQPAATAERFIPDPFGAPGARLYRTGDLARWREDGTVEFLGRRDHQVKIRGFRIELGEIERRLAAHPELRDAVVVAQDSDGVTRLVGYLVPLAGRRPDPATITAWLARSLPPQMVPARLMLLDAIPVTPTGKLDRAALPLPVWEASGARVAPRDETEALLAGIWRDVLAASGPVGVTDNFFDIGGDSILALQIVARARMAGLRITPKQLFECQTVAALAAVAERTADQGAGDAAAATDEAVPGPVPPTPIQSWFFDQPIPNRNRWNQSVLLATAAPVERAILERALAAVAAHHDALRLRFRREEDGRWTQTLAAEPAVIPLDEAEADDDDAVTRLCDGAQGGLDLERGPLMRALLIRREDGGRRLFLVAHHLAVDGVSWRILLEDLRSTAFGPCEGNALPPRSTPFATWARRSAALASDPRILAEAEHWRHALEAPPLPVDRPGGANTRGLAAVRSLRLSAEQTRALLTRAPAAYRTRIDTLLLTALVRTVAARWELPALSIHLEGHGREDPVSGADLSRTVGWFTSVYPVRLAPPGGGWDGAIRHVKEALRAVPGGGAGFNRLRHLGPPELRAALDRGTPSISFNYLGQFDALTADGPWRAADEDCGAGTDPLAPLGALLSFDGQILDGVLTLHARYSTALFDDATVDGLMASYRASLASLIDHCAAVEPGQATPSDFPLAALTQERIDRLPRPAPTIADIVPPTAMQAAMLRHGLRHPDSDAYRVQIWATVDGVDAERLAEAWQTAVARHDILRVCVDGLDGPHPLLVVGKTAELPMELLDWRGLPDPDAAWSALLDRDHRMGFAVDRAPLMRITLARTGPATCRLLWSWHHALLDGWSMSRLLGEILRLLDGETPPLPAARFRDFIAWSRDRDRAEAEALWRERLDSLPVPTLLTRALPPPERPGPDGVALRHLDAAAVDRLQGFAAARKVTLNTLVQAGWLRVLGRVTGRKRVAFGATMSGRSGSLPGIETITGLLVGTLPVVQDAEPGDDLDAWLRGLLADNLALRQYDHAPPADLQCWTDRAEAPFDSVLVFENYPVDDALRARRTDGLSFRDTGNRGRMSYPLTLIVVPQDRLTLRLEYAGSRFDHPTAEMLADALAEAILDIVRTEPRRDCRHLHPGAPNSG